LNKHKNWAKRVLAAALILVLLAANAVVPVAADSSRNAHCSATESAAVQPQNFLARTWNFFWRHFQIMSFGLNPFGGDTFFGYAFNSRWSFQWLFGYNPAYNMFAPAIGASIDTLSNHFYYGGSNWKIVLWKGTYGWGLTTGAEIGLYTRPPERMIAHYDCPMQRDWIDMGFDLYYGNGRRIVRRPAENRWWQTAYAFHLSRRWFDSPRCTIVLVGELGFHTPGKAQAFADALAENGLVEVNRPIVWEADCYDRFAIDGATVRFSWRTALGNNCPIRSADDWQRDGRFLVR